MTNGAHRDWQATVFETFECTLSDGTRVQLRPDGANTPVTYANRVEYLRLCERARLEVRAVISIERTRGERDA